MLTGIIGQLAGAHLTYKDRIRIHTMRDCGYMKVEISNILKMPYTTVRNAVSFLVLIDCSDCSNLICDLVKSSHYP